MVCSVFHIAHESQGQLPKREVHVIWNEKLPLKFATLVILGSAGTVMGSVAQCPLRGS